MRRSKVWINNRLVDIDQARISVFDRGFMYGDGLFETMRSYSGTIFRLDAHIDRLFNSLKIMRMKFLYSRRCLKEAIYKALNTNKLKNAYLRLTITRGEGRFGIHFKDELRPNVVIVAKEFGEYPGWMYSCGITAKVVDIRQSEGSPLAGIKSLNYLIYILARFDAKDVGFDEAILKNRKGCVTEAATSNIFLINRDILITPSLATGVLPGVTRSVVIEIAKRLKLKVNEKTVRYEQLLNADEVFLTNSLVEILPVRKVDNKAIGNGRPGSLTKFLHASYQKQIARETHPRQHTKGRFQN